MSTAVPLYVLDVGAVVTKRGGRLLVARDGKALTSAPLMRLSEVVLFGNVGVTTPALHALLSRDVPVVFLRGDGRARGRLEPAGSPHVQLRLAQLARSADPASCLELARELVAGKLANQRVLLLRRSRRGPGPQREAVRAAAGLLDTHQHAVLEADSLERLRGIEGAASGAYFRALRLLLPAGTGFQRRERRDPDVVNALLNYCAALLREYVIGAITAAGLDPHVSFLHLPMRGRPTLAFDLMEEWRPILVEATMLALLGLRAVTPDDLVPTEEGPRLRPEACAAAIRRFHERLGQAAGVTLSGGGPSYGTRIHRQARRLRTWIQEAQPYKAARWR